MRARSSLFPCIVALLVLGLALAPPGARADGDPPSDVLLASTLYTPVSQTISPPVLAQLRSTIAQAEAGGFKVRVALVLDRSDLGSVPQLLGHPVEYAKLLSSELYYAWKDALIAVQPTGIGVQNIKPLGPAQALADTIVVAKPATADALAAAATTTIRKLASADNGVTFTANPTFVGSGSARSSSTFTTTRILGGVLVLVLILLFVGQLVLRRRRRPARDS